MIPFSFIKSGYSTEAQAIFDRWSALGVAAPDLATKQRVHNTIEYWKSINEWNNKDMIVVETVHAVGADLVNWKNPTGSLVSLVNDYVGRQVINGYNKGNGTTFRQVLPFNPGDGGTYNFTQNSNSFGVYTFDRVVENKIEISAQSAGSVGNDMLLTNNITTKNNSGTARAVTVMTGYGLNSCTRTASNLFKNYRNGYELYGAAPGETDASSAILNLPWAGFCRSVNGIFSSFSSKKHSMKYTGGAHNNLFGFATGYEQYYLNPLGLVPTKRITFNGNSFTSNSIYSAQALADLGSYFYDVNKHGISGQTTVQMQADAVNTVFNKTKSFLTKDVYFIWELTNDLVNTGNATTSYNNMVAYCQALRAAQPNAIIIVATCMPRINITESLRQNDSNLLDSTTLNGKIRNNANGAWDYVCDTASDTAMGMAGQYADTTWYAGDGIHPNVAGYQRLGTNKIAPSLSTALA
jgi:lysophospholipase L1-like esterase